MKIKFWGVRGSLPTPVSPEQIKAKISAAIQRITVKDIENQDSREKFISNLPEWIFGTTGGNSSCVEIVCDDGSEMILDAGSGIRSLGKQKRKPDNLTYNLFFSHFHWDHIQGLPFFDAAYNPMSTINIYSAFEDAEKYLRLQQSEPFFPKSGNFDSFTKKINFTTVNCNETYKIGDVEINFCEMSHPGASYSMSFNEGGKKVVYATDVELSKHDFVFDKTHENLFKNADIIILDSQYTIEEAYKKQNWGHSAFCYAIDFAVRWNIKKLFLFHHEPTYDDKKLNSLLQAARWYAQTIVHSDIEIKLAIEDMEVEL